MATLPPPALASRGSAVFRTRATITAATRRHAASGARNEAGADLLVTSAPYAAPPADTGVRLVAA
jgi:hypothetical protein